MKTAQNVNMYFEKQQIKANTISKLKDSICQLLENKLS